MTVRPHKDRVLLELIIDDKFSDGGLYLPDNAKKKYIRKARVLAVANDCKLPLIPGQTVFAVWNCGVPIEVSGELPNGAANECRLLKSEDIWAVGTFEEVVKSFNERKGR
jgi:co-chaperonin GroES (HSP10)